ncbi:MAG: hypothetical protein FWE35_05125 [Streptosporangiales bacterium]|nr:hypothetical protein [Streptosporangiales bacterium]
MTVASGDIDGVPAFWQAEPGGASRPGTYTAGLVFRTGMADETLATRGVTHLLEHLALYPLHVDAARHVNGQTGQLTTTFLTRGDAGEVAGFFKALCASLRNLPGDRIEKEKQVLRIEASERDSSILQPLLRHRYGAEGYGLAGFPELGLGAVDASGLEAWAARGFTRGNAALWITGGAPPAGLRLDLPDGERSPAPDAPVTIRSTPAYFNTNVAGPAFHGLVERSTAATVYATVLSGILTDELRYKQALTYTPEVSYTVRDGRYAHILAMAAGTRESVSVLTAEFLRILSRLRDQPADADKVREVTERLAAQWDNPDPAAAASLVRRAAQNELLGYQSREPEERRRELAALSPGDLHRVAEEAFANGAFALPRRQKSFIAGLPHIPWTRAEPVTGRDVPSADAPFVAIRLIVGAEGVSVRQGTQSLTVRFADCAALMVRPDGARRLIGLDALEVPVEPTMWRLKPDEISRIDAAVPRDRHVRAPYREPETIPRPGTPPWMRLAGRLAGNVYLAAAVTAVIVLGIPLLIGQFSPVAGFIAALCLALPLLTGLGARKTLRVLLWRAAAKRTEGVGDPPDTG